MNYNRRKQRTRSTGRRPASTLNPELLVKKSTSVKVKPFVSTKAFSHMELDQRLTKNILEKGYKTPTEIQDKCIAPLIDGANLIGIAATGTGKTAAFLIPMVQQMLENNKVTGLVVVPTRELAQQVLDEFKSLTRNTRLISACFIGGTSISKDIAQARKNLNLIVGTPGRLNDLIQRRVLNIDRCSILVLDEFDRMLDMGFIRDIQKLVSEMKSRTQTMLFSATVDVSQEKLIQQIVHKPIRVNVSNGIRPSDNVDQSIIRVGKDENKFEVLLNLISEPSFEKVLLFAETKRAVDKLSRQLIKSGLKSDVIHGNKSQNYRTKAIGQFKAGKTKILVATDVAAGALILKG